MRIIRPLPLAISTSIGMLAVAGWIGFFATHIPPSTVSVVAFTAGLLVVVWAIFGVAYLLSAEKATRQQSQTTKEPHEQAF